MTSNCIFCKIIDKEINSNILYEDNDFQVILDSAPATYGHAILLTKKHYKNFFELDEETAKKLLPVAKKVSKAMKKVLNCSGFNLLQNNGELAGQTVFHFHLHLIPRYEGDGVDFRWKPNKFDDEEIAKMTREIYNECN